MFRHAQDEDADRLVAAVADAVAEEAEAIRRRLLDRAAPACNTVGEQTKGADGVDVRERLQRPG